MATEEHEGRLRSQAVRNHEDNPSPMVRPSQPFSYSEMLDASRVNNVFCNDDSKDEDEDITSCCDSENNVDQLRRQDDGSIPLILTAKIARPTTTDFQEMEPISSSSTPRKSPPRDVIQRHRLSLFFASKLAHSTPATTTNGRTKVQKNERKPSENEMLPIHTSKYPSDEHGDDDDGDDASFPSDPPHFSENLDKSFDETFDGTFDSNMLDQLLFANASQFTTEDHLASQPSDELETCPGEESASSSSSYSSATESANNSKSFGEEYPGEKSFLTNYSIAAESVKSSAAVAPKEQLQDDTLDETFQDDTLDETFQDDTLDETFQDNTLDETYSVDESSSYSISSSPGVGESPESSTFPPKTEELEEEEEGEEHTLGELKEIMESDAAENCATEAEDGLLSQPEALVPVDREEDQTMFTLAFDRLMDCIDPHDPCLENFQCDGNLEFKLPPKPSFHEEDSESFHSMLPCCNIHKDPDALVYSHEEEYMIEDDTFESCRDDDDATLSTQGSVDPADKGTSDAASEADLSSGSMFMNPLGLACEDAEGSSPAKEVNQTLNITSVSEVGGDDSDTMGSNCDLSTERASNVIMVKVGPRIVVEPSASVVSEMGMKC